MAMNVLIMLACIAFFCWMMSAMISSAFRGASSSAEQSQRNLQKTMKDIDKLKRIRRGEKVRDDE